MLRAIEKRNAQKELSIDYSLTIRTSPQKVFQALTSSTVADEWGGGPSRIQAKIHGDISFWDGEMHGSIRELEPPSLLVHTIRHRDWSSSHLDTIVTWKIDPHPRGAFVQMFHTGMSSQKIRNIQDEVWAGSFLGPLKAYLEG